MNIEKLVSKARNGLQAQFEQLSSAKEGNNDLHSKISHTEENIDQPPRKEIEEQERELKEEKSILGHKKKFSELTREEAELLKKIEETIQPVQSKNQKEIEDIKSKFRDLQKNGDPQKLEKLLEEASDYAEDLKQEARIEQELLNLLQKEENEVSEFESILKSDFKALEEEGAISKEISEKYQSQQVMKRELDIESVKEDEENQVAEVELMAVKSINFLAKVISKYSEETSETAEESKELLKLLEENEELIQEHSSTGDQIRKTFEKLMETCQEVGQTAADLAEEAKELAENLRSTLESLNQTAQDMADISNNIKKEISETTKEAGKALGHAIKTLGNITARILAFFA